MSPRQVTLVAAILVTIAASPRIYSQEVRPGRTPVVLDADIGSDIDDAFALAMVLRSPSLDLKAVTTVSGDTQARARIAAKMLWVAGRRDVPVGAGTPDQRPGFAQARWAEGFTSPSLRSESAVDLLKEELDREHGRLVIVAIGPLTNIAELLKRYPEEQGRIKEIVLMGGSVARGYTVGSGPTAEYNIAGDGTSARKVFSSGIPILMAPLDVTAALQLQGADLDRFFAHNTPLTDAVHALYLLWNQPVPTLHDPMAIAMFLNPSLATTKKLDIQVDASGFTRSVPGVPNAEVGLETTPARFISFFEGLFDK